jgi:hypothetical protein
MLLTLLVQGLCGALSGARSGHAAHSNVSTCTVNVDVGIEPLCHSKKVMLLHFSKCSGTTVCALAQQAGCETWKGKHAGVNCGGHLSSNIYHPIRSHPP